jgi:hypothetical protein
MSATCARLTLPPLIGSSSRAAGRPAVAKFSYELTNGSFHPCPTKASFHPDPRTQQRSGVVAGVYQIVVLRCENPIWQARLSDLPSYAVLRRLSL